MPVDAVNALATAISIAKKLREVTDKVKDAEVKLLIADLSIELAEARQQQAEVMEELTTTLTELNRLKDGALPPCPSCGKPAWAVASSAPTTGPFRSLGALDRQYKCRVCDFQETHLVTTSTLDSDRGVAVRAGTQTRRRR